MLNVQEHDHVMPKGGIYGGEVIAINRERKTITFKAGNSELANVHTMPHDQLVKLVLVNHQVQQIPISEQALCG